MKSGDCFKAIADFTAADSSHVLLDEMLQNRAIAYDAIGEHEAAAEDRQRLAARSIAALPEIDDLVGGLVSDWCRRQLLGPLRWVLPAWPMKTFRPQEWQKLRGALRAAQSIERKVLSNEEVLRLVEAQRIIREVLSHR